MTAPARLTDEERALIDAAIAAGRRTVCPPCTGAVSAAGMTPEERARTSQAVRASALHRRSVGERQSAAIARQRRVEALRTAGATQAEIAATIGVSVQTISRDLAEIRRRQR